MLFVTLIFLIPTSWLHLTQDHFTFFEKICRILLEKIALVFKDNAKMREFNTYRE